MRRPLAVVGVSVLAVVLGASCADDPSTTAGQGGQGGVLTGVGSTTSSTGATSSATSQGGAGQGGASQGGAGQGGAFEVDVHTALDPSAGLVLTTALPSDVAACEAIAGAPCADLDGDGLVDAWESIVLDRMRPIQRLDEDEQLVNDPAFVLGDVGRVAPVDGLVHVFIMLGYEKDYGSCGFTGHNGDSERVALELGAVPGGGPGDVRVERVYTAAHEGTTADHSRLFATSELSGLAYDADPATGEPRWVVFPSSDKHGTYATIDICEGISVIPCFDEDCAPDGVANPADYDRLPPFVNAGEETKPLVTDLTALGFPGDDAWAVQDFCGGLGGTSCSDDVRNKLLNDPF